MKKLAKLIAGLSVCSIFIFFIAQNSDGWRKPLLGGEDEYYEEEEFDQEEFEKKIAPWNEQEALSFQKNLKKFGKKPKQNRALGDLEQFGDLRGRWYNRAAMNMPGAFDFTEMLDGTDTIYGVTHNHYSAEYNSKSNIWKGTIYNPKTGTKGDDYVCLTDHWPNRYHDLIAFKINGKTRLIALIENGPVYYSDDEGGSWVMTTGLPNVIYSIALNREDGRIYTTNGTEVYLSTNNGASFTLLQNFGSYGDAALYSPRYGSQPNAEKVYLAREGVFYELNASKTSFIQKGIYSGSHNNIRFSIGGDSRKLYVTESNDYWVSVDNGATWVQKFPKGNWYGTRTSDMNAGKKIGVSPENPDYVMGGYAQPVYSKDGLDTDVSTNSGWGYYQNGNELSLSNYHDRIRFNYHPDFQAQQFFYNSTGDLFSVGSTDGGLFMSYKVWSSAPCDACGAYTIDGYNSDFINITTLGLPSALIYRHSFFTGYKDTRHIVYSTQDQGTQEYVLNSSALTDTIDVHQRIGGDGPPLNSIDGKWVWLYDREGKKTWIPEELYDQNGNRKNIRTVKNAIQANAAVEFSKSTRVGWVQSYIDRDEPSKRIWLLSRRLDRAEVSGTSIAGSSVSKGTGHQVCAFTQATVNPETVFFLQEGIVYKSTNRGDTWDNGTSTPFVKTSNNQNIGSGWVLPGNDNWVLFAGPSANGIGAILSKDGGITWSDITGDLPSGDDFQVGGMTGTPDGKYVFAGTDLGPWVFVVSEEKWYPMYGGEAGMFNTTAIEFIESENLVRFGTWGRGVMEFAIDDNSQVIELNNVASVYNNCDSLTFNYSATNLTGSGIIELLKNGIAVDIWNVAEIASGRIAWFIESNFETGSDYQIRATSGSVSTTSPVFSISKRIEAFSFANLSIDYVDSEHSSDRLASNTIDDDNATFWHTEWTPGNPPYPHEIIYKSLSIEEFAAFSYLPRQDGSSNGRVANYEVYGSDDNKATWTLLKSGTLANQSAIQVVSFDQTMDCDYIKFKMLSEQNGGFYASMSEFGLYTAVSCGVLDCNGDEDGTATLDNCGICAGGNTGVTANVSCVTECSDPVEVFTSSFETTNSGDLTLDDDLLTRWAANGTGEWIMYKFPCPRLVSNLQIAFFSGDQRTTTFDVEVSTDSIAWSSYGQYTSSGNTLEKESFSINSSKITYLKIIGKGNSSNSWNSYTEVDFEFSLQNDCYGDLGGLAFLDSCGTCADGNTGESAVVDPDLCVITSVSVIDQSVRLYPTLLSAGTLIHIGAPIGIVEVYSYEGRLVYQGRNVSTISTDDWASGTYLIQLVNKGRLLRKKVVVR